jgi:hypothetical protein
VDLEDVEISYRVWRGDCRTIPSPPHWEQLPEDVKKIAIGMWQMGVRSASEVADTWGDPQLRDEILELTK